MKRLGLCVILCVIALAGISLGQDSPDAIFIRETQVEQDRPTNIQYDPVFDRFAWVTRSGQLMLVDAQTYAVQHVLYDRGFYNAYKFSHDGRHLALAIDRRIELWDTRTGELVETFEPAGILQANGPLTFTPDDGLLLINSLVPAPPELRRSENDTTNLPWLWDVADALGEARRSLPRRAEFVPFFDFRNGLIIGANRTLIGGYPSRLRVIDGTSPDWNVDAEIDSSRNEQDPIYVWKSANDDFFYVDPRLSGFVQVDTRDNTTVTLPLGRSLEGSNVDRLASPVHFSRSAQIIGDSNHIYPTSLGELIYWDDYVSSNQSRTIMLLDLLEPVTVSEDQTALLMYNYSEREARGMMEIIQIPGTRIRITPDNQRLVVRRNGAQVEIYDIATGVLERTIYPAEPDNGNYVFELTADGKTLLVDFQRFDIATGEMTAYAPEYTRGSEEVFYADDGSAVITRRQNQLIFRDIETGEVKSTAPIDIRGTVIATSPDQTRYLQFDYSLDMATVEIYDVKTQERRSSTFNISSRPVLQVIPRADWQQFLINYTSGDIAVYDFDGNLLTSLLRNDLPYEGDRRLGWVDDYMVYVASSEPNMPPPPEYGLDYHPSGVPACLVAQYPAEWELFIGVWDNLNLRLSLTQLNQLTKRLCDQLPEQAATVVPGLTPTPRFSYNALSGIRLRGGLPDVPQCLTRAFPREQLQYGELWRQLSAGLDEAGKEELAELLCEGLITSLGQIAATPTVNPNLLNAATATPIAAAPESVAAREYGLTVVTVDIATSQRQLGTYIPRLQTPPVRDLGIIYRHFVAEYGVPPSRFAISPDGMRMAELTAQGFLVLYRLTRSYDELAAIEADAQATIIAQRPRDIGLPATATPAFSGIGQPQPTLTPTITPTIPARQLVEIMPVVEDVCPARALYSMQNLPPEYAAAGRIVSASRTGMDVVWLFEPATGLWHIDEGVPPCLMYGDCGLSPDKQWLLYNKDGYITLSRPDGTDETLLARLNNDETGIAVPFYDFIAHHTVRARIEGWIPEKYISPVSMYAFLNPETGETTEYAEMEVPELEIEELPVTLVSRQGADGPMRLALVPYHAPYGNGLGGRFYLYDIRDGTYEYFARSDSGSLQHWWSANGEWLYYRLDGDPAFYAYETATKTHRFARDFGPPNGMLSDDRRYTVYFLDQNEQTYYDRLEAGELPLKIAVWDSETFTTRRYCLPETGAMYGGSNMLWSPDNRYLLFNIQPQAPGADAFPTPVGEETPPPPTATPVPLELQYQLQFPVSVLLDTQTGYVTVIGNEIGIATFWIGDAR